MHAVDVFVQYMDLTRPYALGAGFSTETLNPHSFWSLYGDTLLAPFGKILSLLPATTADIERVWSVAGNVTIGRERITADHLHEDLYVRWNKKIVDMS